MIEEGRGRVIYGIGPIRSDLAVMEWISITCGLFNSCVIGTNGYLFVNFVIAILDDIHARVPAL